ncbi:unnamed protein product [Rotaria sordida]|uniref:Guanylate cyclase n=1 Tax=Rotaria sordida TaxID=392033 RepID=A0A815AI53_9BILA|nr:unnamed protein product [Rotaria sordida]
MYSDTECTRRTGNSIRSCHSTSLSNRYIHGYGSNQDLSKRPQFLSSPTISEIIYNGETFPLLAEFLQIHGRESLVGFCAIVIGISNLTLDKRQALYAVRAAYKQYINDETISNSWLQSTTKDLIRQQISQRIFDPYKIFQPAMKDMLQYLKQNFYSNFLSSQIWKNYLSKKQQDKRIKGRNASTPKKINTSISTSTVKSSKQPIWKRDILINFNGNKTLGSTSSTTTTIKTPLACFIQNKDVPYMIHLNMPVERITLGDIKPRIHHLAGRKFDNQTTECHYYFKRRTDPSEICLMNDGMTSKSTYVYEEIDNDDIHTPVPHLNGTIVYNGLKKRDQFSVHMEFLSSIIIIFIFIPSYLCLNNLTYVFSHTATSDINVLVSSNGLILTNTAYVKRLSSSTVDLLQSTEKLLNATDVQSIVFGWNTGDCSYPSAIALKYPTKYISIPICFTHVSSLNNILRLTVTSEELGQAAVSFMNYYSLHYFSMILSDSNEFYLNLAQKFSSYLSQKSYIFEKLISVSNFSSSSSLIYSLRSRVFFIICSYDEETSLYPIISSSYQSVSSTMRNVIFIFIRWSHHFVSFYTTQFLPNVTLYGPSYIPILHLLPMDSSMTNNLDDMISTYEQDIFNPTSNLPFSDDIIFILSELESVDLLRQISIIDFPLTNRSTMFGQITFDNNQQRSFIYSLIGRQCNGSWAILKSIDSVLINVNTNLNVCISYQFDDTIATITPEDSGWRILRIALFTLLGVALACAAGLIAFFIVRNQRNRKQFSKGPNKIILLPDDLMFVMPKGSIFTSKVNLKNEPHERSNVSIRSEEIQAGKTARYNGDLVEVKKLHIGPLSLRTKVMRELRQLKDLRHENVNTFLGLFIDQNAPALIFEYGHRGSLEDILKKEEIKLDWNFKWSMLNDLVRGMRYLTNSPIRCHGNLKSRNCIVDSRWVLKVTDYHLNEMYTLQNAPRQVEIVDLLWMSPEHIRTAIIKNDVATVMTSSAAGDVYSFGIIMQEVILRGPPFCMLDLTPQEIIAKIKKPPPLLRPSVSKQTAPPEYINSMKQCWAEQAETRPSFNDLAQSIKSLNGGKKVNIVDTMFKMLEQYSNNLEDLIKERTTQLEEEKKKTDKLLSQMLPPSVAESLKSGKAVEAVWYECVTIYFSDIVGFTTISALSSPMEVIDLLNDLYTMFDSILEDFDCYKVETIGDAYMVVSGLPIENGKKHASEIAIMALTLLHACGKFKIRHMPGVPLQLRIGLHSGACVAGVVGLKMPRYCLFGDTVNTASRMESTGMAYRIHSSETTAGLLEEIGGFQLEYRGITEIKGRGNYKTYWLTGKDGFDKELPPPVISENNHGLDKELVKLAEKNAREREKREREKREREPQEKQAPPPPKTTTTTTTLPVNNHIQVQPTIETIASDQKPKKTRNSYVTMTNNINHDMNKTEDLLRFTPPPDAPSSLTSNSTNKHPSPNELPAKLQQMDGPSGPVRKSTKAKW